MIISTDGGRGGCLTGLFLGDEDVSGLEWTVAETRTEKRCTVCGVARKFTHG